MNNILRIVYFLVFFGFVGSMLVVFNTHNSPEFELLGSWKEVSWEYEKLNPEGKVSYFKKQISIQEQAEISKGLVIHKSEIWEFKPGGELILVKPDLEHENLRWSLKGRGHILKLFDKENNPEHYQIYKLKENKMEIHFSSDIQARGIVKMKFEKI